MVPSIPEVVGISLTGFVGQDLTIEFGNLESQFIDLVDGLLEASIDFLSQLGKTSMEFPETACEDISDFTQLGSGCIGFRLARQLTPGIPIVIHRLIQSIPFQFVEQHFDLVQIILTGMKNTGSWIFLEDFFLDEMVKNPGCRLGFRTASQPQGICRSGLGGDLLA